MPKNQWSPEELSERRNPASNHWEFYRDNIGYGHPKCTVDTQETPGEQK
jgi:hypothetical protein